MERPNLADERNWVKVSSTGELAHFETFKEAVCSDISGHLMSLSYYKHHYTQPTSY